MVKRIGVLGGTFNPIHIGHLCLAQTALEKMHLSKVIFVPAYMPPHKKEKTVAAARCRYDMVQLAVKCNPSFKVSDFEIKKEGKSYTYQTMEYFHQQYPKDRLFFIIGEDALPQLPRWRFIERVLRVADFIVVNRSGHLHSSSAIKFFGVTMPGIDISSSYVRKQIADKKTIRYFVPDEVIDYMRRRHLYLNPKKSKRQEI
jgi:nicotinate-nucleotide adenylyltransferase